MLQNLLDADILAHAHTRQQMHARVGRGFIESADNHAHERMVGSHAVAHQTIGNRQLFYDVDPSLSAQAQSLALSGKLAQKNVGKINAGRASAHHANAQWTLSCQRSWLASWLLGCSCCVRLVLVSRHKLQTSEERESHALRVKARGRAQPQSIGSKRSHTQP